RNDQRRHYATLQKNIMTTHITLPRTMTCANLESALLRMQAIQQSTDDIVVDCSGLTFIDPCGLTLLASALETPAAENRHVRFDFLGVNLCSYLERMNFFSYFPAIEGVDLRPSNRN